MSYADPNKQANLLALALAVALLFIGLAAPSRLLGDSAADKPARWSATNFGHTILTRSMWLNHCVPVSQVVSWKLECGLGGATGSRLEQLHIWLGEYALAHDHDPYLADWHFAQAQAAGTRQDPLYGIASFDRALCSFREGEYKQASDAFYNLLIPRTALSGYDRLSVAVWYRKAAACAAYHAQRAKMGIVENAAINPHCGPAALAACLRHLGLACDEDRVAAAVHPEPEGSNLRNIVTGGRRLGVNVRQLRCDETGFKLLVKPMIVQVERDHFVAVTNADNKGVDYIGCNGRWLGDPLHVSWKQWRAMDADVFATVTAPGSDWDRIVADVLSRKRPAARVASASGMMVLKTMALEARLFGHVFVSEGLAGTTYCGQPPSVSGGSAQGHDPKSGEPVNLVTGEEEYVAPVDLTVYNPIGPSVSWAREYNHFRPDDDSYSNDFGRGWSHSYSIGITDENLPGLTTQPANLRSLFMQDGRYIYFSAPAVPSAGNPVPCTVEAGADLAINWAIDSNNPLGYYTVQQADRTTWTFSHPDPNPYCPLYVLTQTKNCDGLLINFVYSNTTSVNGGYLLSAIDDSNGKPLLTINRSTDGTGNITSVSDCYNRSVYYHEDTAFNLYVPNSHTQYSHELQYVSQIQTTGTPPAAGQLDKEVYGYTLVPNGDTPDGNSSEEQIQFLSTISVPSPAGDGSMSKFTIDYDPHTCWVKSQTDAEGNITTFGQGSTPNSTTVRACDKSNNLVKAYTVTYDGIDNLRTWTDGAGTVITTKAYTDSQNPFKPTSIMDGIGRTWIYTYDSYGNILTVSAPSGIVTAKTYAPANTALEELSQVQVTNPAQGLAKAPVSFNYYSDGRLKDVCGPLPGTTGGAQWILAADQFDNMGNLTETWALGPYSTPAGANGFNGQALATYTTTTFAYTNSTITSESVAEPLTVTVTGQNADWSWTPPITASATYDSRGDIASTTDPLNNVTQYTHYDLGGNLMTAVLPATSGSLSGQRTATYSYDYIDGPLLSATIADGNGNPPGRVNYGYGASGELESVTGSLISATYGYDVLYRLSSVTDGNNKTTNYAYNQAGYLASVTYPNNDSTQYTKYNDAGQLLNITDGNNLVTSYAYADLDGRLTGVSYPNTAYAAIAYGYDGFGRLNSVVDGTGSKSFVYDDRDVLTSATTILGANPGVKIAYSYNYDGSRKEMALPQIALYPGGAVQTCQNVWFYSYDGIGRPASLTDPFGNTSSYQYYANGELSLQTLTTGTPSGAISTACSYDAIGQLWGLTNTAASAGELSNYVMPMLGGYDGAGNVTTVASTVGNVSSSTACAYNPAFELTSAGSLTNVYDGAGNPTTLRGQGVTYNSDNETNSGQLRYRYDGNGNPIVYGGTEIGFNADNEPTCIGSVLTADYSADGLRAWKANASGTTTSYIYDGATPVCEMVGGVPSAENTFGPTGLVSRTALIGDGYRLGGYSTTYYTFDEAGNVSQRTNASGAVTSTDSYDAFGKGGTVIGATTPSDPFGFGGQFGYYTDAETGLVLCGQRYYDPGAARWLTRDPIGYAGGVNLYAYCGNNPIGAADPDGTSPWWDNFFSARSPTMVDAQDLEMQYEMSKLDHDGDAGIAAAAVNASWSADLCRRQHSQAISGGTLNLATMAIPGLGEAGAAAEGFEGAEVAEEGVGAYLATKAPMQVTPGTSSLEGQYINDLGQVQPWKAHYDEFGRLVGRTDYNAANKAEGYAATHYHVYGYRGNPRSLGGQVLKIKSHIPGEFTP